MNLPNILTLLRIILTFATTAMLFIDVKYFASAAVLVFFIAGITDWFDGYIARKYNIITTFGKFMDALSDKIMVVTMFMTLFAQHLYQQWTLLALVCAIISMSREFYISGVRMIASNKGVVIAAETLGKYKAAFQMYSIGAIMFAHAMRCDFIDMQHSPIYTFFYNLSFYSGVGTLSLATILSIISAISYSVKYSNLLKDY